MLISHLVSVSAVVEFQTFTLMDWTIKNRKINVLKNVCEISDGTEDLGCVVSFCKCLLAPKLNISKIVLVTKQSQTI